MSSVADCSRITNGVLRRVLLRAEFKAEEINAEKDMLYKRNPVEDLCRELKIANFVGNLYLRSRGTQIGKNLCTPR